MTKIGLFEIDVKGNLLTYTLPLRFDVTMRQPTMFGDIIKSTKVEARVKFETEYNIKNDWTLNCATKQRASGQTMNRIGGLITVRYSRHHWQTAKNSNSPPFAMAIACRSMCSR